MTTALTIWRPQRNTIYAMDALQYLWQIPDNTVHCVVTSPPYYGLRNYGVTGQIGLEDTPDAYLKRMVAVFREVRRVLRPDGVCWLNMGDSFNSTPAGANPGGFQGEAMRWDENYNHAQARNKVKGSYANGYKPKDLMLMPHRLALAFQSDGWWVRMDNVWCLSGGTYVYTQTQKGEMPMMIKDMARLKPETVKLWNGEKWTRVLGWSKTKRKGTELEITLRSGERIACTPNHRFPTERGLLEAGSLQVGDILKQTCLPEPERPLNANAIGLDAAWFIGLYLAEGSRADDTIQIAGHRDEAERYERVQRFAEFFGCSVTRTLDGNKQNIRVYGKLINALIDTYISGHTAHDKGLAVRCWMHSNEWLQSLLDGYLSGDGGWDEQNQRWRLGFTRNYNLERDLRTLAARLGFKLTLKLSIATMDGRKFPSFRGEIRFNHNTTHHNAKSPMEIIAISKSRCRYVYDIGVEDEPHLFAFASGVLTHNSKPNPMPESVTDRPSKAHEYVFLLTKSDRYWYDAEAVREAMARMWNPKTNGGSITTGWGEKSGGAMGGMKTRPKGYPEPNPAGRNLRSVWTIPTEPTPFAHFATFPQALVETCLKAGCPQKVCAECGQGWVREVERETSEFNLIEGAKQRIRANTMTGGTERVTLGKTHLISRLDKGFHPTCTCNATDTQPGIVLDPFMGSGTTALVARRLGRDYMGCDLNPEYVKLAQDRLRDSDPYQHKQVADGLTQLSLFQESA